MSTYSTYDLSESIDILNTREGVPISRESISTVHYAWGHSPEGWGSWTGGFILELKDGRFVTIEGWCDTTGWGCQDGVTATFSDTLPEKPAGFRSDDWAEPPHQWIEADHLPADLNRWVQGEFDVD